MTDTTPAGATALERARLCDAVAQWLRSDPEFPATMVELTVPKPARLPMLLLALVEQFAESIRGASGAELAASRLEGNATSWRQRHHEDWDGWDA